MILFEIKSAYVCYFGRSYVHLHICVCTYTFVCAHVYGIKKGGVIVYLRDDFATDGNVLTSGSNGVVEWLVLHLVAKNLIIITIYRPPTCPNNLFTQIIHDINNQIEAMGTPSPTIIMSGDFNLPIIEWPSGEIRGGHAYMRVQAQVLLEFSNNHMMEQCILEPTRGHNILDLFFCQRP